MRATGAYPLHFRHTVHTWMFSLNININHLYACYRTGRHDIPLFSIRWRPDFGGAAGLLRSVRDRCVGCGRCWAASAGWGGSASAYSIVCGIIRQLLLDYGRNTRLVGKGPDSP